MKLGQKSVKNLVGFLGDLKTPKFILRLADLQGVNFRFVGWLPQLYFNLLFILWSSLSTNFFPTGFDENPKAFFWKFLEYKMPHIKLSNSLTMSSIVNTSNGVQQDSQTPNQCNFKKLSRLIELFAKFVTIINYQLKPSAFLIGIPVGIMNKIY